MPSALFFSAHLAEFHSTCLLTRRQTCMGGAIGTDSTAAAVPLFSGLRFDKTRFCRTMFL